jgi:hypothetical protein
MRPESVRRRAAVLMFVTLAGCAAPPDQSVRHQQTNIEPGKCFGLDVNYSFIADRSEKPFYEATRTVIPFNFANSFYFDLDHTIISQIAYAKVVVAPESATLRFLFFSADGSFVFQKTDFHNAEVIECGLDRTILSASTFTRVPWLGVDYRITVTFSSSENKIRLETDVEIVPRLNPFNEKGYRQYKAEFRPYE